MGRGHKQVVTLVDSYRCLTRKANDMAAVGDRIEFGGNLIKRRSGTIIKIIPTSKAFLEPVVVKVQAEKLYAWEKPEDLIFMVVLPE